VVEGYRQILSGEVSPVDISEKCNRNEQLYRLHNVYTYRKNLEALKKIEEEFKNCRFEPELHPKTELVQSRYL
jgi:hypothetical protein